MLKFLGRINIATQLMFLIVVVVGLAILFLRWVATDDTSQMLRQRMNSELADSCQLRAHAIRDSLRMISNRIREVAENLSEKTRTPQINARLLAEVEAPSKLTGAFDETVIRECSVVEIRNANIVNVITLHRDGKQKWMVDTNQSPTEPSSVPASDIWNQLSPSKKSKNLKGIQKQLASQLCPIDHVGRVQNNSEKNQRFPISYQTAIGYAIPQANNENPLYLIANIDLTQIIARQAKHRPQSLLFVHGPDGKWIYHPDETKIGTKDPTWILTLPRKQAIIRRESSFSSYPMLVPGGDTISELKYYTIRKQLSDQFTTASTNIRWLDDVFNQESDLIFGPVYEGATSVVLSSTKPEVLEKIFKVIEERESSLQNRPEQIAPKPIECNSYVGFYLPNVPVGLNETDMIGLVVAGALEVIQADANVTFVQWILFLVILVASALVALVAGHILIRPLTRLTEATKRLGEGDLSVDVEVKAAGEVGELARAFKQMAEQIRQREVELSENLAKMQTILNNAADGIITFDQSGTIEQANASAVEMFKATNGGLVGTRVQELMKLPDSVTRISKSSTAKAGQLSSGHSFGTFHGAGVTLYVDAVKLPGEEHRGIKRDGSTFWMEVTFSQVPVEDRRIITGIFRDVTRRKLDEERIRQMNDELDARVKLRTAQLEDARSKLEVALNQAEAASAAKDCFIKVVSHELRTPLTAVKGFTELLVRVFGDKTNVKSQPMRDNPVPTLTKILTSCSHLLTLINDLLDIGRYTAGKPIDLTYNRFELNGFLRGVLEMVAPLVRKNVNQLKTNIPDNLGEAYNDETRLRQMLLNLLSNASKFTENGTITLEVERIPVTRASISPYSASDILVLRVRDTGEGMTPENLRELFKPFYRVNNSMSRKQGGTGLGLTITKMICELMGGTIDVESQPGMGSTFTLRVPVEIQLHDLQPVDPSDPMKLTASSINIHNHVKNIILVIDDDASIREMLDTYLSQEGFKVIHASTGDEGLKLAREVQPMCITLDVLMPDQDGWNVLGMLKNDPATRDIPVIMLTILEEKNRGFTLGATEYLTKPIDWERLGHILCRYYRPASPILIVDDDSLQRSYLRDVLTQSNWSVVMEASNGVEALQICETTTPSLILLDLMMPIMDGFQFLEELRRRPEGMSIPVVVLTAMTLSNEDRRRLNRGVAQVIAKESLSKEQLLDRIRDQMQDRLKPTPTP